MGFKLDRIHVWSGEIPDQPGAMSTKLAPLAQAGANLEFILTRRQPNSPGCGVLYVAPVTGAASVPRQRTVPLTQRSLAMVPFVTPSIRTKVFD